MRTMFQMGFSPAPFFLGQQALDRDDQTKLTNDLIDAEGIQDIIAGWKKNHPNVDADMGSDAVRFKALETKAAGLESVAKAVMNRVMQPDPAEVTLAELSQTKDWINTIHDQYMLVAAHTGKAQPPAAAPAAAPATTSPVLNPVALGIGAVGLLILVVVAIK